MTTSFLSRVRTTTISPMKATAKRVRPRRDFQALRDRRLRAGEMFKRGSTQADAAQGLGVSRETASQWFAAWREGVTHMMVERREIDTRY